MARRRDNFGVLRLGAATGVLISHAFGLTGNVDPVGIVTSETLGGMAVTVFFAISGFLVVGSWYRDPDLLRFLGRRLKRIWPGLTVAVLFTAYVVGPLFTDLPVGRYMDAADTHAWVLGRLAMLPGHWTLPGVFLHNSLVAPNGSLWTLAVECKAYLVVAVVGVAGALRGGRFLWGAWALATVAAVAAAADMPATTGMSRQEVELFAVFLGGGLLYRERERIPLHAAIAALLAGGWLATRGTPLQAGMAAAAFPYCCVWLAYRTRPVLTGLVARADLSYGIYLYGYPVQQAVRAALGDSSTPLLVIAIPLPIAAALAFVSWHAVEKPWLRKKRGRQVVVPAPAPALAET